MRIRCLTQRPIANGHTDPLLELVYASINSQLGIERPGLMSGGLGAARADYRGLLKGKVVMTHKMTISLVTARSREQTIRLAI